MQEELVKNKKTTEGNFEITEDSLVYVESEADKASTPTNHLRDANENYLKYLIRKTLRTFPGHADHPHYIATHIKLTYGIMCTYNDVMALFKEDKIKSNVMRLFEDDQWDDYYGEHSIYYY